jgi:hypothetical protein
MSTLKNINKLRVVKRNDRELVANINMILLGQETMRGIFWNVAGVDYDPGKHTLKIGITTANNKLGTTLEKMRKNAKLISEHLYNVGVLNCRARVYFTLHKESEDQLRLDNLLERFSHSETKEKEEVLG